MVPLNCPGISGCGYAKDYKARCRFRCKICCIHGPVSDAEIGLAINERRKTQGDEYVEETTFVDITLWGRTAEVAAEYLSKGSPVLIEGRLKLDTWETDGQKRSKLKVVGERMQMLGAKPSKRQEDELSKATAHGFGGGDDIPY